MGKINVMLFITDCSLSNAPFKNYVTVAIVRLLF